VCDAAARVTGPSKMSATTSSRQLWSSSSSAAGEHASMDQIVMNAAKTGDFRARR
jgi:hypothetical protein